MHLDSTLSKIFIHTVWINFHDCHFLKYEELKFAVNNIYYCYSIYLLLTRSFHLRLFLINIIVSVQNLNLWKFASVSAVKIKIKMYKNNTSNNIMIWKMFNRDI